MIFFWGNQWLFFATDSILDIDDKICWNNPYENFTMQDISFPRGNGRGMALSIFWQPNNFVEYPIRKVFKNKTIWNLFWCEWGRQVWFSFHWDKGVHHGSIQVANRHWIAILIHFSPLAGGKYKLTLKRRRKQKSKYLNFKKFAYN